MSQRPVTRRAVLLDGVLLTGLLTGQHRDDVPSGILRLGFTLDDTPRHPSAATRTRWDASQGRAGARDVAMAEDLPPRRIDVLGLGTYGAQVLATLAPPRGTQTVESLSMAEARQALDTSHLVLLVVPWREAESTRRAAQLAQCAAAHDIYVLALGPMPDARAVRDQHQHAQAGFARLRPWARCLLTLPPVPGGLVGPDSAGQVIAGLIDFLRPGLAGTDLADITDIFRGEGEVLVGVGQATGTERALAAARSARAQAWRTAASVAGVQVALMTIRGSRNMRLEELHLAALTAFTGLPTEASYLLGGLHDPSLRETVRVTLVAMWGQSSRPRGMRVTDIFTSFCTLP